MMSLDPRANVWGSVYFGDGCKVGAFCDIGGSPTANTVIGKNCKIQCHVSIPPGTKIGDGVFVGPGARFANDRVPNLEQKEWKPLGAIVEDSAVIGMGAMIGAGVTIGKGAIIGMGSVVTKDVPAGEVWAGNPARPLVQDITQ